MSNEEKRAECAHEFVPIPGWRGRYRCKWCKALAYRKFVIGDQLDHAGPTRRDFKHWMVRRSPRMILYRCARKGCNNPAVTYDRFKRGQLCFKHLKEK
jgi:hypothetical protein